MGWLVLNFWHLVDCVLEGWLWWYSLKKEHAGCSIYLIFKKDNIFPFCFEAYKTKVSRNGNIAKLQAGYLFPEVFDTAWSFCFVLTLICLMITPLIVHYFKCHLSFSHLFVMFTMHVFFPWDALFRKRFLYIKDFYVSVYMSQFNHSYVGGWKCIKHVPRHSRWKIGHFFREKE